jgi:hypothetical protein
MRRYCRPNLRLAPYSLCLCFSRPPATALISIQEEIFSHPFALILMISTSALRHLMKVGNNILALNRDCLPNCSALASNQCVW